MSETPDSENSTNFQDIITWALKTTLRLVAAAVLIVLLAVIIYFLLLQLNSRFSATNQRIDLLHDDLGQVLTNDSEQRQLLLELQSTVEAESSQSERFATALSDRSDQIQTLELEAAVLTDSNDTISKTLILLTADLADMQSESTLTQEQLDEIAGDVAELTTNVNSLETIAEELSSSQSDQEEQLFQLREILALIRVWELVTQARIHLAERNAGLALSNTEQALASLDALDLANMTDETTNLEDIRLRLNLTLDALADSPDASARDLENAWVQLHRLVISLLGPDFTPAELPELEVTVPIEPTPTLETTPAIEPSPTPTASPTPSA